jgi:integrase
LPPELLLAKKYTFADLADKYDKWAKENRKSYEKDKKYKIRWLKSYFLEFPLNKFDIDTLEELQIVLKTKDIEDPDCVRNKELDGGTINRWIACLKHMLSKAKQWKMISAQILWDIRDIEMKTENPGRVRWLSVEECNDLLQAAAPHIRPVLITCLHTGLRKSNVTMMEWEHVDLETGVIKIPWTKTKQKKFHEAPMSETVKNMLDKMPRLSQFVFTNCNGKPYRNISKAFKNALNVVGITDFKLHDLRHTFASQLHLNGTDIYTISALLGHSSIAMTNKYTHVNKDAAKRTVSIFDKMSGAVCK